MRKLAFNFTECTSLIVFCLLLFFITTALKIADHLEKKA
jgi:hypothetical protein